MSALLTAAAVVVYVGALVAVSVTDVRERRVPNRVVLPAAAAVLVLHTAARPGVEWLLAGLAAAGFLLVAALLRPEGLGMGDVKLTFLLGVMLGRDVVWGLALGLVGAGLWGLVLLARRRGRHATMPLAPFLAVGGLTALALLL